MTGAYERTTERLLRGQPKPQKCGRLIGHHFWTGHKSLHRTRQSRTWRLFWRMKARRV